MRSKALERIKKSNAQFITAIQAADILGYAYISLIKKIRNGSDVGFSYEYISDQKCYIPRAEFVESLENWKWTAERLKMLKENFISVSQAANAIGCAERTLRSDIKNGKALGFDYCQIGGIWRISKKSFLKFMEGEQK